MTSSLTFPIHGRPDWLNAGVGAGLLGTDRLLPMGIVSSVRPLVAAASLLQLLAELDVVQRERGTSWPVG